LWWTIIADIERRIQRNVFFLYKQQWCLIERSIPCHDSDLTNWIRHFPWFCTMFSITASKARTCFPVSALRLGMLRLI